MAIGSKRDRGDGGYLFIDGRALRADEVVHIELDDSTSVPGQEEAASGSGQGEAQRATAREGKRRFRSLEEMDSEDAFALRDDTSGGTLPFSHTESLLTDERRKIRRKNLIFGLIFLVIICFSFCVSNSYYYTIYAPGDVLACFISWFRLSFIGLTDPNSFVQARFDVMTQLPMYMDVIGQVLEVFKYIVCGALLALSGMLYQNAFRNPIASPSMLGVSNGINLALLILTMQFGIYAQQMIGYYYLYSYAGGFIVLLLVMFGGKWISGKHRFSVVNMLLIGTIVSQLVGIIITYVQNMYMGDEAWYVFYRLQIAAANESIWTFVTLFCGAIISLVPIMIFRFRLNLVSFSDEETKILGVNPNRLRILALTCGSIMILTAQVNAGQVAMASLVVPFIARAAFGVEFRKQIMGNILIGAPLLLVCGDIISIVNINGVALDIGSVVTICALPLFIWMLAIRQRSWE